LTWIVPMSLDPFLGVNVVFCSAAFSRALTISAKRHSLVMLTAFLNMT
jgi:hypothetical protein